MDAFSPRTVKGEVMMSDGLRMATNQSTSAQMNANQSPKQDLLKHDVFRFKETNKRRWLGLLKDSVRWSGIVSTTNQKRSFGRLLSANHIFIVTNTLFASCLPNNNREIIVFIYEFKISFTKVPLIIQGRIRSPDLP